MQAADAMRARRVDDARAEMKKAEDALKTGLFKWSKDYDTAARAFQEAGNRFQMSAMLEEGKNAFVRAAECKMKASHPSPFFAAKNLESACLCAERQAEELEEGNPKRASLVREAASYLLEANTYYQTNGNFERALEAIQKAAKVCEQDDPDRALQNYKMLATVTIHLEKPGKVLALDAVREGINFCVKNSSFSDALELMAIYRRFCIEIDQHLELAKACIGTIVLHLANGDGESAGAAVNELTQEVPSFLGTEDYAAITDVLAAYADGDEEALKKSKKNERLLRLDTPMVRCVAGLSVTGANVDASLSYNKVLDLNGEAGGAPKHVDLGADPDDEGTELC